MTITSIDKSCHNHWQRSTKFNYKHNKIAADQRPNKHKNWSGLVLELLLHFRFQERAAIVNRLTKITSDKKHIAWQTHSSRHRFQRIWNDRTLKRSVVRSLRVYWPTRVECCDYTVSINIVCCMHGTRYNVEIISEFDGYRLLMFCCCWYCCYFWLFGLSALTFISTNSRNNWLDIVYKEH